MPDRARLTDTQGVFAGLVGVDPGWLQTEAAQTYLADLVVAAALLGPDLAAAPVVPNFDPAWPDSESAR